MEATIDLTNRDIRQRELIPAEKLKNLNVTVIGVGAIGRQVSIQLAAIGAQKLRLIDFDNVAVENLAAQGFMENDLSKPKVEAVGELCQAINSQILVETKNTKFNNAMFPGGALFMCVDSIDTRKQIFEGICNKADFFIDGRMSSEYMRVLTVTNLESKEYYKTQLFPSSEAFVGTCTAKTTIYCATMAASLMVSQFVKWLRDLDVDKEVCINLLSNEMRAI